MNSVPDSTIGCPHCQKRFHWKASLAGVSVRCTCGEVFTFPKAPDALASSPWPFEKDATSQPPADASRRSGTLAPSDFDDPVIDDSLNEGDLLVRCPACNLDMKASAKVCLNCGYDATKRSKVKTQVLDPLELPALSRPLTGSPAFDRGDDDVADDNTDRRGAPTDGPSAEALSRRPSTVARALARREDEVKGSRFNDIYLPIIFIIAGIGLWIWVGYLGEQPIGDTLKSMTIYVVVVVPLLLATLYGTARAWGTSYGSLGIGLLKLTGLAMGPMALADFIGFFILVYTLGFGALFVWFLRTIMVGFPLSRMFDLDLHETMATVAAIMIIRFFFEYLVLPVVLSLL